MIIYHPNTVEGVESGKALMGRLVALAPLSVVWLGYQKHEGIIYEIMGEMWWN